MQRIIKKTILLLIVGLTAMLAIINISDIIMFILNPDAFFFGTETVDKQGCHYVNSKTFILFNTILALTSIVILFLFGYNIIHKRGALICMLILILINFIL